MLKDIQKPQKVKTCSPSIIDNKSNNGLLVPIPRPETPKTSESLGSFRKEIEVNIAQHEGLDARTKLNIQKIVNAAENAFADRAIILLDENMLLFEQKNEKTTRKSIKATVVGNAKVLSYGDIVEAKQKRDMEVEGGIRGRQNVKRKRLIPTQALGKRSRSYERKEAIDESGRRD